MLRFRSFRTRLLVLLLALMAAAQLVAFLVVARVHRTNAIRDIEQQLEAASRQFERVVSQRNADFARAGEGLTRDVGLRQALAADIDAATLRSVLINLRRRIAADLVVLLSLDGSTRAETRDGPPAEAVYRPLHSAADMSEFARATGYGMIDGALFSFTVVPFHAPHIIAWVGIGFRIDGDFLRELKEATGVEVTLEHGGATLATTLAAPDTRVAPVGSSGHTQNARAGSERGTYITRTLRLPLVAGAPATIALQYSLEEKLAPARRVQRLLGWVFGGSLLLAAALALWVARNVSEPVHQLAAHTRHIAAGDYARRIELARADELGQLASALNAMSAGLAERDRVRDLLDKNVSPEVAAQLLRDGAALGGEEREVTILFADLRGFTTLSEQLAPRDLLTLLNRYLDRMSSEIERHGGVIDKFIGDAIMALFGAPVTQPDAARRAAAAAVAMETALDELNAELAAEGTPPLALGIGINTARVVAGNIGSHRRLNYSVLGDGVNVAARLQALTRTAEYRTNIIVSAATAAALRRGTSGSPGSQIHGEHAHATFALRPLGTVQVKGRAEPVEIFAVAADAPPKTTPAPASA